MLTPEFKTSNIGIAIRVVNNKKMTASEICNLYWQSANLKGKVFFGTNVPIDVNKKSAIKKLFLFANNSVERFLCCATVEKVFIMCNPVEEGLCSKELLLSEDKTKQYKNWFLVSGFEQVQIQDCGIMCLNGTSNYLKDQIEVHRFRSCLVDMNSK